MDLHIFNPEHDIALAYDVPHLTIPHVAQEMRMNLGFLPAFWAKDGDAVLVDDIKYALKASKQYKGMIADVLFVEKTDLASLPLDGVKPWGWDCRVCAELAENGVAADILPTEGQLADVRRFSDREQTKEMLHAVRKGIEGDTCGESFVATAMDEACSIIRQLGNAVVKAPWSSSGRGVRYVSDAADQPKLSWIRHTLQHQGKVMIEPRYNKMCDFAMEFVSTPDGGVRYCGLSVFKTLNAQYTGNVVGSERFKCDLLSRYVSETLLDDIASRLEQNLTAMLSGRYAGEFGVDMMVVAGAEGDRFLLHPCVEINLRRTMGHLALSLYGGDDEHARLMSIVHDVNYQLKLQRIEGEYVNVL